jgi:hypothetical protein
MPPPYCTNIPASTNLRVTLQHSDICFISELGDISRYCISARDISCSCAHTWGQLPLSCTYRTLTLLHRRFGRIAIYCFFVTFTGLHIAQISQHQLTYTLHFNTLRLCFISELGDISRQCISTRDISCSCVYTRE